MPFTFCFSLWMITYAVCICFFLYVTVVIQNDSSIKQILFYRCLANVTRPCPLLLVEVIIELSKHFLYKIVILWKRARVCVCVLLKRRNLFYAAQEAGSFCQYGTRQVSVDPLKGFLLKHLVPSCCASPLDYRYTLLRRDKLLPSSYYLSLIHI